MEVIIKRHILYEHKHILSTFIEFNIFTFMDDTVKVNCSHVCTTKHYMITKIYFPMIYRKSNTFM